jgi:MFS family permease
MEEPFTKKDQLKIKNNIWKFYLGSLLGGFAFFYNAIDTLYYRNFGLTFQQIGWIISICLITTLIIEIPSGAFADLYGKREALIISALLNFIGTGFVAFGSSFPLFLIGFAFWGAGRAFSSGASSALLFDTLKKLKKEKEFLKHTGRLSSFFISIDIISSALAPLLFAVNVRLPYFISLTAAFFVIIIQLSVCEVLESKNNQKNVLEENIQQILSGIKTAFKNKIFICLTLFNVLIFTINKTFAEMLSTPFLTSYIGYKLQSLSVILVIGSLIQSVTVFFADKIENKLGNKYSFFGIIYVLPIILIFYVFSRNILLTSVLTGIYFSIISFSEVVVENYLSKNTSDDKRATVLSISSMITSIVAFISLPIIGYITDIIYLQNSIVLLASIILVIGTVLLSRIKTIL